MTMQAHGEMKRVYRGALIMLFCLAALLAAQPKGQSQAISQKNYVPDEQTAIKIAEAVLIPIYGSQKVAAERPFHAHLDGNIWTIEGTLHSELGGVATVRIARSDGRILSVTHGK
jgi:hypothetical protein